MKYQSSWRIMEAKAKFEPKVVRTESNTIILKDLAGYKVGHCYLTHKKAHIRYHGLRIQEIEFLTDGFRLHFNWYDVHHGTHHQH